MSTTGKPGAKAPRSGQYEIIGPRGGRTGDERTVTRGEPLPPHPKTRAGLQDRRPHQAQERTVRSFHTVAAGAVLTWIRRPAACLGRPLDRRRRPVVFVAVED